MLTELLWTLWPFFQAVGRCTEQLFGDLRPLRTFIERTAHAEGPAPGEIDLVVTWVDGDKADRRALRERYARAESGYSPDAVCPYRFQDNGELRYLLRSVSQFAPWVRRIFVVVSDHQRPAWVREHPRLQFVNDTEIFADPRHLPTFNSHALECNLHRIPGLAEHYLYLNDDMMFGRPVLPEDFVDPRSGALKLYLTRGMTATLPLDPRHNAHRNAWRTTNGLLDERFGKEPRPYPCHGATILRRSLARQSEEVFGAFYEATTSRRFRTPGDIHPVGLQLYHALYVGAARALQASHASDLVRLDRWRPLLQCDLRVLERDRPMMFCINDGNSAHHDVLRDFYERYFPNPSEFELMGSGAPASATAL